jgi:hypothetical protein
VAFLNASVNYSKHEQSSPSSPTKPIAGFANVFSIQFLILATSAVTAIVIPAAVI